MNTTHPVPALLGKLSARAFAVGGAALAIAAIGGFAFGRPTEFFRSYLLAFLFWTGVGVGCLSLLFIQHLTGGRWGLLLRRLLEAGGRTLPFMAVAFIPVVIGIPRLYAWGNPDVVAGDAILQHKRIFLNPAFFTGRGFLYFLVWTSVIHFASVWSLRLDTSAERLRLERRLRGLAGGGLLLLGLTITFSSIDWAMSLEAHWFSTVYGVAFMVGQVLSAFTLMILLLAATGAEEPFRRVLDRDTVHDLGKLLFAFVMLWAYIHLSQFLIIWSANLPEEIPWYLRRTGGGWRLLAYVVIAAHFVAPFFALLSRGLKRNLPRLATVAAVVFAARWLDLYWLVAPSFERPHLSLLWMDAAAAVGLGGIWVGLFARELVARPLLPQGHPDLQAGAHA